MEPDNVIDCKHSDFDEKERAGVKYDFCTGCLAWRDASDVVTPGPWMLTDRPKRKAPAKPKPEAAEKSSDVGIKAARSLIEVYRASGESGRGVIRSLVEALVQGETNGNDVETVAKCADEMSAEDREYATWQFGKIDGAKP